MDNYPDGRIVARQCYLGDYYLLLTSKCLPLQEKERLYSACVYSLMLYKNDTLPVNKNIVIRLEKHAARIARQKSNLRPANMISTVKLKNRLQMRGWVH